jgi:AraC-like DNA-binding protein
MTATDSAGVAQIRSRALTGYVELVTELGGDARKLMQRHHINPSHLEDGDAMIDFRQMIRLLEASATQFDCADFGLRLAQRQGLDVLGPLALLARNSLTVQDALIAVARHLPYHSPSLRLESGADPQMPACHYLSYDILLPDCPQRRQTVELAVNVALCTLTLLIKEQSMIRHARFRHPAGLTMADYRRYFPCRLVFGQESNAVVFDSKGLKTPVADSNPEIRRVAEAFVAHIVERYPRDLRGQVEALIQRQLSSPQCTVSIIADQLAMHPRTLQRRLESIGLRFDTLIDNLRKERALEYLKQPGIRLIAVAQLLGYTEQTSLNRSCQRWFGMSPQDVRNG